MCNDNLYFVVNVNNNKCASIEAWLKAIVLTSTRQVIKVSSSVDFWLYKFKENCLILRIVGLTRYKIRG